MVKRVDNNNNNNNNNNIIIIIIISALKWMDIISNTYCKYRLVV
jgi:hypothetical protein